MQAALFHANLFTLFITQASSCGGRQSVAGCRIHVTYNLIRRDSVAEPAHIGIRFSPESKISCAGGRRGISDGNGIGSGNILFCILVAVKEPPNRASKNFAVIRFTTVSYC